MNRFLLLFIVIFPPVFSSAQNVLVIKNVSVIDMKDSIPKQNQTVIIKGNKITSIDNKTKIPESAKIIDGTNKFLIPGLWDMHVHSLYEGRPDFFFPMFIANGVTGVREMGSSMPPGQINAIRRQIENGKIIGPRFGAVADKILDAEQLGPEFEAVTTPDEGREAVRKHKAAGADFIKVYNSLSRQVYFSIVDECKKQNIPFAGHLPISIYAAEASDAGQKSMEHLYGILTACSSREEEFRNTDTGAYKLTFEQLVNSFDYEKSETLFKTFVRNETFQCPTLVLARVWAFAHDSNFLKDARLKYIPVKNVEKWKTDMAEWKEMGKIWLAKALELTNEMNKFHVLLLAGTDAGLGNEYTFAGFSLHDELALLVHAGLTPLQALETATINPAKFLNKEKELGTIEKGKLADMVLLDANPLNDIHNTQKIYAVIANGRLLQRKDLNELLEKAKKLAAKQ